MRKKREKKEGGDDAAPRKDVKPKEVVLGCVLKFDGLDGVEGCSREDLKALCGDGVSYVEYERGLAAGFVRLDGARAEEVRAKIAPEGSATLKGASVEVAVLAGDDEQAYWARLAEAAAASRKRQGSGRRGGWRGKKKAKTS